jgi:hypothetical protein
MLDPLVRDLYRKFRWKERLGWFGATMADAFALTGAGRVRTWMDEPLLRKWLALAAFVFLLSFGLMSWAVVVYLRGGNPEDEPTVVGPKSPDGLDAWMDLFNGRDLSGWTPMLTRGQNNRGEVQESVTSGWKVENGELVYDTSESGWIRCDERLGDFELSFEFQLPKGANSGVIFRYPGQGLLAPEIQLEDDPAEKAKGANKQTGALFGLVPPSSDVFRSSTILSMHVRISTAWEQRSTHCLQAARRSKDVPVLKQSTRSNSKIPRCPPSIISRFRRCLKAK